METARQREKTNSVLYTAKLKSSTAARRNFCSRYSQGAAYLNFISNWTKKLKEIMSVNGKPRCERRLWYLCGRNSRSFS